MAPSWSCGDTRDQHGATRPRWSPTKSVDGAGREIKPACGRGSTAKSGRGWRRGDGSTERSASRGFFGVNWGPRSAEARCLSPFFNSQLGDQVKAAAERGIGRSVLDRGRRRVLAIRRLPRPFPGLAAIGVAVADQVIFAVRGGDSGRLGAARDAAQMGGDIETRDRFRRHAQAPAAYQQHRQAMAVIRYSWGSRGQSAQKAAGGDRRRRLRAAAISAIIVQHASFLEHWPRIGRRSGLPPRHVLQFGLNFLQGLAHGWQCPFLHVGMIVGAFNVNGHQLLAGPSQHITDQRDLPLVASDNRVKSIARACRGPFARAAQADGVAIEIDPVEIDVLPVEVEVDVAFGKRMHSRARAC